MVDGIFSRDSSQETSFPMSAARPKGVMPGALASNLVCIGQAARPMMAAWLVQGSPKVHLSPKAQGS